MKVFIPISDKLLSDPAAMCGALVPFDPDFLLADTPTSSAKKPLNWIVASDYHAAKVRLSHAPPVHL